MPKFCFIGKLLCPSAVIQGWCEFIVTKQPVLNKYSYMYIVFVNKSKMSLLHHIYCNENDDTDCITVTQTEAPLSVCRIFISNDKVLDNSVLYRTSTSFELFLYILHSMLHAVGYQDQEKATRKKMFNITKKIFVHAIVCNHVCSKYIDESFIKTLH